MAKQQVAGEMPRPQTGYKKRIALPFEQKQLEWYFSTEDGGEVLTIRDAPTDQFKAVFWPYARQLADPAFCVPGKKGGTRRMPAPLRIELESLIEELESLATWRAHDRWALLYALAEPGMVTLPIYESAEQARRALVREDVAS